MSTSPDPRIKDILFFWFGDLPDDETFPTEHAELWFKASDAFDQEIRNRYGETLERAANGKLKAWTKTPEGWLALIIVLDQFSRNIFRGTPKAFAQDPLALSVALSGIRQGMDKQLKPVQAIFAFLPLEHAENLELQKQCVEHYEALAERASPAIDFVIRNNVDYAYRHLRIIEQFGRFPHRNEILGRESTAEELEFLKQQGSSF